MRDRNLPQLKRFWFCENKHGACSCRKAKEVLCQSIINTPEQHIDKIRASERLKRLPRASAFWDNEKEQRSLRPDFHAAMRMAFHDGEIIRRISHKRPNPSAIPREMIDSEVLRQLSAVGESLTKEMLLLSGSLQSMRGYRPEWVILDEASLWKEVSQKLPKTEPYIEGNPDKPKPWQRFIEPNHRKKPR